MIEHIKPEVDISRPVTMNNGRKRNKVKALYALSRRNLWEVLLFLLISIGAYGFRHFDLFAAASEPVRQVLGYPPPVMLVNAALAVYLFSAVTMQLTGMANCHRPEQKWQHLGYRSVFYLFYSCSGSLSGHFIVVFTIGMLLYVLQQIHLWIYTDRVVRRDTEPLGER